MSVEWYYANDAGEQVPITEERLEQLAADKLINAKTLVWNADLPDWQPCGLLHPEWFSSELKSDSPPQLPAHIKPNTVKQTHPLAIASIICGIVSIIPLGCLGILGIVASPIAIAAIICGHVALKKIRLQENEFDGGGLALAGLITGYLGLVATLLLTALMGFAFILPSVKAPKIEATPTSPEAIQTTPSSLPEGQ